MCADSALQPHGTHVMPTQQSNPAPTAGDRRWLMIVEGQGSDYAGEAVNPRFLSLFEIALGYGRRYQARAATFHRIATSRDACA